MEARVKGMYGEEVEQRQTNESAAPKGIWQSDQARIEGRSEQHKGG